MKHIGWGGQDLYNHQTKSEGKVFSNKREATLGCLLMKFQERWVSIGVILCLVGY